jgi:hypothetical protein
MFIGAVTLLGAYEVSVENKYWMQSNEQTPSPDVMASLQVETTEGFNLLLNKMEIVEMERHAGTDDIVDFLLENKLSKLKSYAEDDMIVLVVNKQIPIDHRKIHIRLEELKPKPTIYIIGRPLGVEPGGFSIFSPYPFLTTPLQFNVNDTAARYWIPDKVSFSLSSEKKIRFTKSNDLRPTNTYETLGLDKSKIYKRFGIES